MWIVAIAWIYVVSLMALTETNFVAGFMTLFGYCVIPLSILFYITGGKRRRARRERQRANSGDAEPTRSPDTPAGGGSDSSSN